MRLFPVEHICCFYLITALTLGAAVKTWTMRQRQTRWCHHRGNDLVGQMGLSMVSVGNMVRALQGHGWGLVAAPDLGQLPLLCRIFPALKSYSMAFRRAIASHWRQDLTPVLQQSLVLNPLESKELSPVEAPRAGDSCASVFLAEKLSELYSCHLCCFFLYQGNSCKSSTSLAALFLLAHQPLPHHVVIEEVSHRGWI